MLINAQCRNSSIMMKVLSHFSPNDGHKKTHNHVGFFDHQNLYSFNSYVATAKLTFHFEFYYAVSSSK